MSVLAKTSSIDNLVEKTPSNSDSYSDSSYEFKKAEFYNQLNQRSTESENVNSTIYSKSSDEANDLSCNRTFSDENNQSFSIMSNLRNKNQKGFFSDEIIDDSSELIDKIDQKDPEADSINNELREKKEIVVFKKHMMKKFSKFKRQNDINTQSQEDNFNENSESEPSHQKKPRKHIDEKSDTYAYVNTFKNSNISDNDLNKTTDISNKSDNSRSSCSSSVSTSSGIGSSNGNTGSELNSDATFVKTGDIIDLLFQKKDTHYNRNKSNDALSNNDALLNEKDKICDLKSINNLTPSTNGEENDVECDISEENDEQNMDFNSNYDAENEEENDLDTSASHDADDDDDDDDDDPINKKVQMPSQVTKASNLRSKRFYDTKLQMPSVYNKFHKNDDLVNSLYKTMNEILTSQLILTRKVDCISEQFTIVDRRLKDIEFGYKKSSKKNRIQSKRIANEKMNHIKLNDSKTHQLIKQKNAIETTGVISEDRDMETETPPDDTNTNHSSNTVSKNKQTDSTSKLLKDTLLTQSRKQVLLNESSDCSSSLSKSFSGPINSRDVDSNNNMTACESANNIMTKNHMLSISNLTENLNKPQNMTYTQQQKSLYSPNNLNSSHNNKQIDHRSLGPKNNSDPYPQLAKAELEESVNSLRANIYNNVNHKANKFSFGNDLVLKPACNSHSPNSKLAFVEQSNNNSRIKSHSNLMKQMSLNGNSISNKLNSNCFSNPSYQFHNQTNPMFQHSSQHQLSHQQNHSHEQQHNRAAHAQISHLIHSQGSHSSFNHPFIQSSTSSPSNLLMTSTTKGSNSKDCVGSNSSRNLALALSAPACSNSIRNSMSHDFSDNLRSDQNNYNLENEENDYDSVDEEDDASYHQSSQQRGTIEHAANFIAQQHGLIRHIPTGSIDQLELDEEAEMLVSRDVIKRCVRKAKHRGNFAANLAAELFTKEERVTCNCTGTRGKRQLSPRRLHLVKDITFRMYNTNAAVLAAASSNDASTAAVATAAMNAAYHEFEEAWRKECITAIDAKNRSIGRDLIKTSYNNENKCNQMSKEISITVNNTDTNTSSPDAISTPFSNTDSINTTEVNDL